MTSHEKRFDKFFESMPDTDSDWMGITDSDMSKLYEYQEKADNLDYLLTYFVCDTFEQLDELLKARSHEVISLLEKNEQLKENMLELRRDLE